MSRSISPRSSTTDSTTIELYVTTGVDSGFIQHLAPGGSFTLANTSKTKWKVHVMRGSQYRTKIPSLTVPPERQTDVNLDVDGQLYFGSEITNIPYAMMTSEYSDHPKAFDLNDTVTVANSSPNWPVTIKIIAYDGKSYSNTVGPNQQFTVGFEQGSVVWYQPEPFGSAIPEGQKMVWAMRLDRPYGMGLQHSEAESSVANRGVGDGVWKLP